MRFCVSIILVWLVASTQALGCETLADQLRIDEPRVKSFVSTLKLGQKLRGITLCEGSRIFEGWRYVGPKAKLLPGQHVHIFRDGKARRAVAWVATAGSPLDVPTCPYGSRCASMTEGVLGISGDIYTYRKIHAAGNVVIVMYPPASW